MNHCAEFAELNPEAAEKMKTCSDRATEENGSILLGCGEGLGQFAASTGDHAISLWDRLIYGDPEVEAERAANLQFRQICENDTSLAIKRELVREAWLEGVSRPLTDEQLRQTSCQRLMNDVTARRNFAVVQELGRNLESPEFEEQWDRERERFFESLELQATALAQGLDIRLNCYNSQAKAAIVCKILAAAAAGMAAH